MPVCGEREPRRLPTMSYRSAVITCSERAAADPAVLDAAQREWPVQRHKLDP